MGRLMALAAERLTRNSQPGARILDWQGDITSKGQSVPLRFAGALHGMILSGQAPDLAACYPPNDVSDDRLWSEIERLMATLPAPFNAWLDSPPQTNEVRRAAVLIAAGHWLTARYGLPLKLSEIGASAGLNLMWDRFALDLPGTVLGPDHPALRLNPDWTGDLPPAAQPQVVARRGVDLNPLDPADPARISAYIWPDQPERLARTRAAIAVAEAPVDRADAIEWLPARLAEPHDGQLHLLFHTIAWQYLPEQARDKGEAIIAQAGARATESAPLARFAMEADSTDRGAGLTLTTWPGGQTIPMGRVDFHGRWVDWRAPCAML